MMCAGIADPTTLPDLNPPVALPPLDIVELVSPFEPEWFRCGMAFWSYDTFLELDFGARLLLLLDTLPFIASKAACSPLLNLEEAFLRPLPSGLTSLDGPAEAFEATLRS